MWRSRASLWQLQALRHKRKGNWVRGPSTHAFAAASRARSRPPWPPQAEAGVSVRCKLPRLSAPEDLEPRRHKSAARPLDGLRFCCRDRCTCPRVMRTGSIPRAPQSPTEPHRAPQSPETNLSVSRLRERHQCPGAHSTPSLAEVASHRIAQPRCAIAQARSGSGTRGAAAGFRCTLELPLGTAMALASVNVHLASASDGLRQPQRLRPAAGAVPGLGSTELRLRRRVNPKLAIRASRNGGPEFDDKNKSDGDKGAVDWDKAWESFPKPKKRARSASFLSLFNINMEQYVNRRPTPSNFPLSEETDPTRKAERQALDAWVDPKFTYAGMGVVVGLFVYMVVIVGPPS